MNLSHPIKSGVVSKVILILACLLILLLVFQAGMFVGFRKGLFTSQWNDNYSRGFDDPRSVFAPFMMDGDMPNPHGVVGTIASQNLPNLIVKGRGTAEEVVVVGPETVIRGIRHSASTSDLVAGRQVVIIGEPDENGRLRASLIRVMPPMPPDFETPFRP